MYGGFPVKLRTYLGDPIPYDPKITAEELAEKVNYSFFLNLWTDFYFQLLFKNEFIHSTDMFQSVVLFSQGTFGSVSKHLSYCHDRQVLGGGGAMGL